MKNIIIYNLVTYLYLFCTLLYTIHVIFKVKKLGKIATSVTLFTLVIHCAAFFIRWAESYQMEIGHLPVRGPYEGLTFSAGIIIIFYIFIEQRIKTRAFSLFVLPLVSLMMIYASLSTQVDNSIHPMPEVLQGNYINYHMLSCFVGYGAFAVSFAASILILLISTGTVTSSNMLCKIHINRETLDNINYKMIAIGFIMFTIMIVTGMFRCKIIWGKYWQWDYVQTWSLLAWIAYAVILHGRYTWKWRVTTTAIFSIIGFILSVISFLIGAGLISKSMHYPLTG
jgi:cytochrome c-type biogenesis protein CcsB